MKFVHVGSSPFKRLNLSNYQNPDRLLVPLGLPRRRAPIQCPAGWQQLQKGALLHADANYSDVTLPEIEVPRLSRRTWAPRGTTRDGRPW